MNKADIWFFNSVHCCLITGWRRNHSSPTAMIGNFSLKKRPSLQFKFDNGMIHEKCDFVNHDNLAKEQQKQTKDLCYFRYGSKNRKLMNAKHF